jgi:glycosyltransferase involved in cell wall biosynthesis
MTQTVALNGELTPLVTPAVGAHTAALVSIGLPVYNEAQHLRAALDALLAQDYDNFELIISDNASTDETAAICTEYAARDARICYHRNETNIGGISNFNQVFAAARGEFFAWAAGHDLRHPSFISRCVAVLQQEPAVVLCHPLALWLDEVGQIQEPISSRLDTRGIPDRLSRFNMVLWGLTTGFPIYGVMRVSALKQTRMYRQVVSPDITLLAELSLLGEFAHLHEPLLYARRPPDYGSWDVYVRKHFEGRVKGWAAQVLFWRMLRELLTGVVRHVNSITEKAAGSASVLMCMFTKYRWMLVGLLSLRRRA